MSTIAQNLQKLDYFTTCNNLLILTNDTTSVPRNTNAENFSTLAVHRLILQIDKLPEIDSISNKELIVLQLLFQVCYKYFQ